MTEEEVEKRRAANRTSYQRNRESRLARNKQWRLENPERMKELNKAWHARHPRYSSERSRKFRLSDPERVKELVRKWYLNNKEKTIGTARQQRTGCTPERYQELLTSQQGVCAICGKPPGKYALAADHSHATGAVSESVRGLLCMNCNTALGLVGDDIAILAAMIAYLTKVPDQGF